MLRKTKGILRWIAALLPEGYRGVYAEKLPAEHRQSLRGSLAKFSNERVSAGEEWEEARRAAWDEAARDGENTEEGGR